MTENTAAPSGTAETPDVPENVRRVAFLGLGNMGGPMARNLVAAGVRVSGFDPVPEAVEAARGAGVEIAESGPDAVRQADVVITMLPHGRLVRSAYVGAEGSGAEENAEGLLDAVRPGTLFVDCSTIDIAEAQDIARLTEAAGFAAVDAPVSGGVVGAEAGTLAFMVGAADEAFARAEPLLRIMGARIVHCGGHGMGQAAKICNNLMLAITQIGAAEAFVLGERLGLDPQVQYDVMSQSTGQSWAVNVNCPVPGPVPASPANRGFEGGFMGALMAKDLGLALSALNREGVDAVLGRTCQRLYAAFAAGEGADQDFSGIIETVRADAASASLEAASPTQDAAQTDHAENGVDREDRT
ncbi:3-hydroxyisobutyrate dehydrogenase [Micrococcus cohnii]|uniref:3-hydroxyisobutyrate dehydrogenase n=1 Tax=Micrococcus cohnii TaxID=993416 RepID=A0A7W7DY42_9MICC|nr:3-hydroxyisobutyrate dehydrogenase [Micrococcus cohnii]MBB4734506.1 3-hydroxyisobutyrate dehydrogenase [Micrococcus cohnii]